MATRLTRTDRDFGHIVEKQMRNWELAHGPKKDSPVSRGLQPVEQFISLSRAVGLPGDTIAEQLHERLGWPVFDREILLAMAGEDHYRERIYESLDERDTSWLEDFCQALSQGRHISREDYFARLTETVVALARKGNAIFLGRATDLILPKDTGLRVRLAASRDFCIHQYATSKKLTYDSAAAQLEQIEHERARFLRNHFHVEASEHTRHDLIINMERFDVPQAVELILTAMKVRNIVT